LISAQAWSLLKILSLLLPLPLPHYVHSHTCSLSHPLKTHTQNTTNKKILLEYKIGENQGDLGFDNDFVDTVPKAQSMKEKKNNDKLELH